MKTLLALFAFACLCAAQSPTLSIENMDAVGCQAFNAVMPNGQCVPHVFAVAYALNPEVTAVRFSADFVDETGKTFHEERIEVVGTLGGSKGSALYYRLTHGTWHLKRLSATALLDSDVTLSQSF